MSKIKLLSNASGTGNVTVTSPATNSDRSITLPDGDGAMPLIKLETAKTATGTAVDFTSIPSWVKRITVMFSDLSTNGTSQYICQLGDSGGVENTGYAGGILSGGSFTVYSAGFSFNTNVAAASVYYGSVTILKLNGNQWVATTACNAGATFANGSGSGSKTLSDTLDRIRITTVNGTDTFDAGTINIMYEG
jgi:hypothetical protein